MWQGNNALIPVLNSNLVLHDYDLEKKQSYEIQKLFMYYYVQDNKKELLSLTLTKVVRVDWLGNSENHKKDYNVFLFHVVCTVTVRIFCSWCDASLVYWLFAHLHLKTFCYLCTVNAIFQLVKREQKHKTKKVIKFPNQSIIFARSCYRSKV